MIRDDHLQEGNDPNGEMVAAPIGESSETGPGPLSLRRASVPKDR
jgi:hypothetical protein